MERACLMRPLSRCLDIPADPMQYLARELGYVDSVGGEYLWGSCIAPAKTVGLDDCAVELVYGTRADLSAPDPSCKFVVGSVKDHSGELCVGDGRLDPCPVAVDIQEHADEDEPIVAKCCGVGPERREVRPVELTLLGFCQWPRSVQLVTVQQDVRSASSPELDGDLMAKGALADPGGSRNDQYLNVRGGHGVPSNGRPHGR